MKIAKYFDLILSHKLTFLLAFTDLKGTRGGEFHF
jgi:hypothetical protein